MVRLLTASAQRAKAGESMCGDAWDLVDRGERVVIVLADGLGHGPEARAAADRAIEAVRAEAGGSLTEMLAAAHDASGRTRGCVLSIAEFDLECELLRYCAIGNSGGRVLTPAGCRVLPSQPGIVGRSWRNPTIQDWPFGDGDLAVLHSDGLSDRFVLGVADRYADLQALVDRLLAVYGREHDDCLVVAARREPRE